MTVTAISSGLTYRIRDIDTSKPLGHLIYLRNVKTSKTSMVLIRSHILDMEIWNLDTSIWNEPDRPTNGNQ